MVDKSDVFQDLNTFPQGWRLKKFVDIDLPTDDAEVTTASGVEETKMRFRTIGGRPPRSVERYMSQSTDGKSLRLADKNAADSCLAADQFPNTTQGMLERHDNINVLDYKRAMELFKAYEFAADSGKVYHSPQSEIDECYKRALLCCIKGFSLRPYDLILTSIINRFHETGVTQKFPDETARLLEVAIRMKLEDGNHRYEFFDAYWEFQQKRGKTAEAVKFVQDSLQCFTRMNIVASKSFNTVLKEHEIGDVLRLQQVKDAVCGGLSLRRQESPDRQVLPAMMLVGGYRDYIVNYCLAYKGDHAEARRVFNIVQKQEEEMSRANADSMQRGIESLIPDFHVFVEDTDTARGGLSGIRRRVAHKTALTMGDMHDALNVVKAAYASKDIVYDMYSAELDVFLRDFVEQAGASRENAQVIPILKTLFEAEEKGELRIPIETKNICMARMAEAQFREKNYTAVVAFYEAAGAARGNNGMVLRGEEYYAAKAYFAIGGDEAIQKGVKAICSALPQFADTDWEYEIWKEYVLPNYEKHKDVIHSAYSGKRASQVLGEIVKTNPDNVSAHLARIDFAIRTNTHLESLAGYVNQMIEAGIHDMVAVISVARKLRGREKLSEAAAVLKLMPGYKENLGISALLCEILLSPSLLTKGSYQEAFVLAGGHQGLRDSLSGQFSAARERLEMEAFEPVPFPVFLGRTMDKHKNSNAVPDDDSVSMAIVFGKLRDVAEIQKGEFRGFEAAGLNCEALQADSAPVCTTLADIFGIERVRFERKDGGFAAICILKQNGGNKLKREFFTAEFSREDGLASAGGVEYAVEDEAKTKLFIRLLEAAVQEEFLARLGGKEQAGFVEEACSETNAERTKLRRLIADYKHAKSPFYSEKPGMEGIEERNKMICARIEKALDTLSKNPNFPAREELLGLIQRYIEIIKTCRDLDEPVMVYNSAIDNTNPLSRYIKYLRIFSADFARSRLRQTGAGEEALGNFSQSVSRKGNFAGYYELVCYFGEEEESGEVPISVFLDNKGVATIPGISRDNPLYEHLWMLALESLMMKVVPEMGPFTKVFGKRNFKSTDRQSPFLSGDLEDRLSQDFRVTSRRRVCCSALVIAAEQSQEASTAPARKVDVLDDVCGAFTLVELSEKDITQWPLYISRDGKRVKKVEGLFVRKEDKTYVVAEKLREVFGKETGEISEETVEITALQEGMRKKLLQALRVQILGGRSYRMPVDFKSPEYDIETIDGKEYFLIPAENKRGDTVERGGKLFRLKKVPPHTKVDIEGETYFATPWQMSDEMDEIYKKTATIKVDFSPSLVSYAVLYDGATHEILAYTYIGSVKDSRVQEYVSATKRGELCTMKDPKAALAFQDRQGLKEAVFFVETNTGYKQGVFPPVWRYLAASRSTHDAAMRLLLDEMGRKVGTKKLGELKKDLKGEENPEDVTVSDEKKEIKPPRKPKKSKKPPPPPALPVIPSPNTVYRMEESPRASQYSGLCGLDLYIVDKKNPLHGVLSGVFNIKAGEALVCVGKPDGRASKVKKEFLVEQKSGEDEE